MEKNIHYRIKENSRMSLQRNATWRSVKTFRRVAVQLILAGVFILPCAAQTPLDENAVQERIMQRKNMEGYKEKTPWDNSKKYVNKVEFDGCPPGYFTGYGCYGFMMDMMEYASYYEYPIRIIEGSYDNLPTIHIGDGVRVKNDAHSVVVIDKSSDGQEITVAEGNYNHSVHWGRKLNLADPAVGFTYIATFWPDNPIATGLADNEINSSRNVRIFNLSGTLVKSLSQTDLPVQAVLRELPKGFYIVKDKTRTYKVYNKGE